MNAARRQIPPAIVAIVAGSTALLGSGAATAQEINITGPLFITCGSGYCWPLRRTRLEATLGLAVLGETVTGAPMGSRVEAASTLGLNVEARLMPASVHGRSMGHGVAMGATAVLGPTLRFERGRVREQVITDTAYVFEFHLERGDEGNTVRHILGFAELGISGRWAWFDTAPTSFALGPRVSLGVDGHWGRCGKRILGLGFDVRSLHATFGGALHTVLISGQIRVGWDLPYKSDCDDFFAARRGACERTRTTRRG
jgi:hypothetical protein